MPPTSQIDLETRVRRWIKKQTKENQRLEFKLKVEVGTQGGKAEFIRDVISLANSEGEMPRTDGYLVMGFKDGRYFDIRKEHYDIATFGQILDSFVYPQLRVGYEEFLYDRARSIGVLVVSPNARSLYLVNKSLPGDGGKPILLPGQCWGRRSGRKVALTGEEISIRSKRILDDRIRQVTEPLQQKIERLQADSGAILEVKRIRFDMEATPEWAALEAHTRKLVPYAREFDQTVKHEVLNAVMHLTGRTRFGMPSEVARAIDGVLMELLPVTTGGLHHPAQESISDEDQRLLARMEHAVFEMTWDACRYLRDMEILDVAARLYWALIRFATLNRLERFQAQCLKNARYCESICSEQRKGTAFGEGQSKLQAEICDAINAFD